MNFLFLITFTSVLVTVIYAKQQCLLVRGMVRCGKNSTQPSVFVKLVDYDGPSNKNKKIGMRSNLAQLKLFSVAADDEMDEVYASKSSGSFQLYGCASDTVGDIDPELHFYHKCKGEEKRIRFIISDKLIDKEYNYTKTIYLDKDFTEDEKAYFGYSDTDSKPYPIQNCIKS